MHELEHLRTKVTGENAELTMSRDDSVNGKVDEEIRCKAQMFVGVMHYGNAWDAANTP